ncbi:single-stranded-DNA-specific exonuclease RecJ [Teredinibacter purpureus]|uniref:single-stranded-DNA-specific exonuclease RecJ n=1 Tax=Teredinibacter purpureus TaxID=2731756 RepID=UPI0006968788|nr:single-stranded-DNA-specific exonuclease RecJ [Teredinibacter purpureus]
MIKKIRRRTPINSEDEGLAALPPLIRRVLLNRRVTDLVAVDYSLSNLQPPGAMGGLDAAVELLFEALTTQKRVCILGDFDADGATSTALAVRCLRAFGFQSVSYIVPNRFEYGYGLTTEIVEVIATLSPDLLITVDNGIASLEGVVAAQRHGMKVLVTDHHLPGATLPVAEAIVNPNQPGCNFGSKSLAGVGVIFYVMNAFRAYLRKLNWFVDHQLVEPRMADYLDLVALGTVADVVPLDQNNRILVDQGLRRIRAGHCAHGIRALFEVGGRALPRLSATDLGFVAGPRLNAAGRLDDMSLGIRCLLADTYNEARQVAVELDSLNRERRAIEGSMQVEAIKYLDELLLHNKPWPLGICLYKDDWHQGVIGILASRIKDKLHRPTIIFASSGDGTLKGSGRSIAGIHLRDVLDRIATGSPGLLTKFGGHAMAAGLSLDESKLEVFKVAFQTVVGELLDGKAPEAELLTDGGLEDDWFTLDSARELESFGPWGQLFPEPCFDGAFRIISQRIVGEKHLKLQVTPAEYSGVALAAIAFNVDLDVWPNNDIQQATLVYKLSVNEYRGEQTLQLMVDYLEPAV